MRCHVAAVVSYTASPIVKPPARFTAAATPPVLSTTCLTAAATAAGSSRSVANGRALPRGNSCASACSAAASRSSSATRSPFAAKCAATARPRAPAAPVISTLRTSAVMFAPALRVIVASAAHDDLIFRQQRRWFELRLRLCAFVQGSEIDVRQSKQIVEAVEHEVGLLKIVDAITGAHHALDGKADPMWRRVLECEHAFGARARDSRAVNPEPFRLHDQPELDRVPVDACEQRQRAESLRSQPADAIRLDEVGNDRIDQQRGVAEHIVKDVGFLEVIELVGTPDELSRREASVRQMLEEHLVGNQPWNRNDAPAGRSHQHVAEALEVWDVLGGYRQRVHAVDECIAGAATQ